ncbi:16725300-4642-46ba-b890-d2acf0ccf584 [Sclerotinia trifoliorum]|uniref:16725300-4642-46ba-b890-d2acf0ccf584 n=1 Tax=Sclerotinia trifoliorum TaxID=28548 RepID=A0A8H2ZNE1_9HELO|nr:16725300-4642-46ba-b890-d2acf0ccf584 [Sclerotinia trifoliorum]
MVYANASSKLPWIATICAFFLCWSVWFREVLYRTTFSEYVVRPDVCRTDRENPFPPHEHAENETIQGENITATTVKEPSNERPLILYAFSESPEARINIQYFIDHGLHDAADFIFILNGETDIHKNIPQKDNIKHIHRPNDCFDLGGYAEVLTKTDLYKNYRKFIMLNASLRGPFLPSWSQSCWSSLYLSRITDTTKLIGMTANCEPEFHIQSMIWATDSKGIETLLFPSKDVLAKLPPQPMHAIKGPFNASEKYTPGINNCFRSFNGAINAEIGVTALMRTAGYGVEAIMSAFHGVGNGKDEEVFEKERGDHRHHHKDFGEDSYEKQDKSSDLMSEYERFCGSTGTGDVLYDGGYFGINVHPFETIFMKTNRNIGPVALEKLTDWMEGSRFSSYDYCKL